MVLKSDLSLDISKFDPSSVTPQQNEFNMEMEKSTVASGRWYNVGAQTYRKLREEGKTPIPSRTVLPEGIDFTIPSREPGREIPCRLLLPSSGATPVATFMHIHGGGWVLNSHIDFDPYLRQLSEGSGTGMPIAAVSVGYRLAPENPFPACIDDCCDAAEWLVKNAVSDERFGNAPLRYIGGESAGGHLTVLTTLHLLNLTDPYDGLKGLVLHFGVFTLDLLGSCTNFNRELVLTNDIMEAYIEAVTPPQRKNDPTYVKDKSVSPLFVDLEKFRGRLPAAIFTCGTADPLLDDTLLMGTKWMAAGCKDTFIKIYPGQPHGYCFFPKDKVPAAGEAAEAIGEFFKLTSS